MDSLSRIIRSGIEISRETTGRVGKRTGRSLHITGASCLGNTVVGLGKLVMGVLSMSFFTCASAFYTFGMVTAKCFALAGIVKEENSKEQYRYYKTAGFILILSSVLYMIYSVRLFIVPAVSVYHEYIALGIATFTFTELGLNIRGVIMERHNHSPLVHAIKMINLASSLICLVLTQTAILSFSSDREDTHQGANGFMGLLMGAAATVLGIVMIVRITRLQKKRMDGMEGKMINILVLEDDVKLNRTVCTYLNDSGFSAKGCLSANAAYEEMYNNMYELIVSDIMMPEIDGFAFARTVRQVNQHIPILFMSAKDDLSSKQKGFQCGIDDYMVKPIELDELLLRVRALLRRANIETERKLVVGNLELDADAMTADIDGVEIPVTTREFNILYKLLSYPKKTFSRTQLMDEFWGVDSETSLRAVDVYITKLRDKFSACGSFEIKTVRGLGYKAVLL